MTRTGCKCRRGTGDAEAPGINLSEAVGIESPSTVIAVDRTGAPVTLTPGLLDDEARYVFTAGQCVALAVALAEKSGWPVYVESRVYDGRYPTGDGAPDRLDSNAEIVHAMVEMPDGRVLDVRGPAIGEARMSFVKSPTRYGRNTYMPPVRIPPERAREILNRKRDKDLRPQDVETAALFADAVIASAA
jgi:hypothetical protein